MRRKWPPLPKVIAGIAGPIEVRVVDAIEPAPDTPEKLGDVGSWEGPKERLIRLQKDMAPDAMWHTLWHEWAHAVLHDTGVTNLLTRENEECLCDAFSTARIREMLDSRP